MPIPVFNTMDRALLTETLRPLAATLVVVMAALLMERLLRLLRLVTSGGGPLDLVGWMALNLIPHYLGLAIPAALFLAVYLVVGRLQSDSELDSLRGAGVSVRRASRAFLLLGVAAAAVNLAVVGWLQPLGRYGYRALVHAVSQEVWDMTLPERTLVRVTDGVLISAETVSEGGLRLGGVFVRQEDADGAVTVTTARIGRIVLTADATRARIQLAGGVLVRREPAGAQHGLEFSELTDVVTVRVAPTPFRPRGAEERELTLPELAGALDSAPRRAEYNARLARILSVAFVPMLAVGVGIAAKRAPRGLGLAAGGLGLFLFHHLLLTGEGLADAGRLGAGPAIWAPAGLFAVLAAGVFLRLDRRAGA
ncbi:MAG: LptF/LptG family permease [Pseudomonadota bacterium]